LLVCSRPTLAGLAYLLCLSLLATSTSAAELQWRKGGPKHLQPTADSQPIAKAAKPKPRHDGAVRTVAFEDNAFERNAVQANVDGPSFGTQQAGGTNVHSVVVEPDPTERSNNDDADIFAGDGVRSAQAQFRPRSEADGRYNEQITEPFGQQPAGQQSVETESTEIEDDIFLPQADTTEPDLAPPPADSNEVSVPDTTSRQRGPEQYPPGTAPRSFQPAPSDTTPRPDPFVPLDDEPDAGLPPVNDRSLSDEGARSQADCSREFAKLRAHTLNKVNLSIAISGKPGEDFPYECSIDDGTWYTGRCWDETTYMWKASALCHKPLYFEDEALERYGHSWGPYLDPFVSGAHFFCKLPVLPYCMGVTPPTECMYALGHYRPGNCAPYTIDPVPISLRGAAFEAGAWVGGVFIIP
jgi:hypothetical protein